MKTTRADTLVIRTGELLRASFLFEAIIHPMRKRLLQLLMEEGELTAGTLCRKLHFEKELCLQQLSILCGVELLYRKAEGDYIIYTVNHEKVEALFSAADALSV